MARFLSGLPSSFDGARSQILKIKEFPSLSEVFSRLRQATLPYVAPSHINRSTLVDSVESSRPSGPYRPPSFSRNPPDCPDVILVETFSPVAKIGSTRILLSCQQSWVAFISIGCEE